jgi:uncharacterized protein
MTLTISKQTARRYVLGRQGLWPGRRWSGRDGVAGAIRQCECVQIDTINAIARNHDIKLWSRVQDYAPPMLESLMYDERLFFDFGSILMVYPAEEMPYWRAIMRCQRERHAGAMENRREVIDHVRQELRARGPLASRDFTGRQRVPGGFNMVKDSAVALYLLWLVGEIVTHSRRGFDRVYEMAPTSDRALTCEEATDAEAERYFALKATRDLGLATAAEWSRRVRVYLHRAAARSPATAVEALGANGCIVQVTVEGEKNGCWAPAEDAALLQQIEAGGVPDAWTPIAVTTDEEANFLAPLDNVVWDRARTKALFDFDYVWEVYKPAHLRRWGYYTLPILWGDRLVARFAPRLNRKTRTLVVEGYWPEDDAVTSDRAFRAAAAAGMSRFCAFHCADAIEAGPMRDLLGPGFAPSLDG